MYFLMYFLQYKINLFLGSIMRKVYYGVIDQNLTP